MKSFLLALLLLVVHLSNARTNNSLESVSYGDNIDINSKKDYHFHYDLMDDENHLLDKRKNELTKNKYVVKKRHSNDPVKFTLYCEKKHVYTGEEIEIKISAEIMNISPQSMFFLERLKDFRLKLIFPENFIQTGGDYYDNVGFDFRQSTSKSITYTARGKFADGHGDKCFDLIRTSGSIELDQLYVKKALLCVKVVESKRTDFNQNARRSVACSDNSLTQFGFTATGSDNNANSATNASGPSQLPVRKSD